MRDALQSVISAARAELPAAASTRATVKYGYVDAVRGYAVVMVIVCHTGALFLELPYPVKKLTNFGWHGVQLFFLMSCMTLLMSWRSDEARGQADPAAFLLRRFFRIAPMYYAAALLYFVVEPPASGFDLGQFAASMLFVNCWHPSTMPADFSLWQVVPGGWSIGVEFTFYVLFPVIAALVTTWRRAVAATLVSIAFGLAANAAVDVFAPQHSAFTTTAFLYFWFPNQLPVFMSGALLFFMLKAGAVMPDAPVPSMLRRRGDMIATGCLICCVICANLPFPARLPSVSPLVLPRLYVASSIFLVFVAALASKPDSLFVNGPIRLLGKASFSAYLLHFAILRQLAALLPQALDVHATGLKAIGACAMLMCAVLPVTFVASLATYAVIEEPMIAFGRRVVSARLRMAAATA